ncbi:MAG: AAA family ATPase [Deltaproteobacteria bacterium]|nr:AAA family ATPase [Deltaproteobacteria bacterium]
MSVHAVKKQSSKSEAQAQGQAQPQGPAEARVAATSDRLEYVERGSLESRIIEEELELLARVQRELAEDSLAAGVHGEYDKELIALRDQIAEAHVEDLAPLIAEMYRMQAIGAQNGKGRALPVDVNCPYFGHLKLNDGKKTRDVLIGNRGFVKPGSRAAIVDWRNAPVSRIYYCYEEGDDYEEEFGNRPVSGVVEARRTVSILNGELRRISWSTGAVARRGDGQWVLIPIAQRPTLKGGAGSAVRPPSAHEPPAHFNPGKLGVVGDESLREDKHLREITALIDPEQFDAITRPDSGIVILQGGAGSGKTTVALHRAAYLHFRDPETFSPRKMAVVVKSAPLTEYISRVLPSLDVAGTPVVTLHDWMHRTRTKVMPEVKKTYVSDVPAAVARLKKHPAILTLLERGVEAEANDIGESLAAIVEGAAREAVQRRWADLASRALLPRIRDMLQWVEGPGGQRAMLKGAEKSAIVGVLRRARTSASDIMGAWSDLLSDASLIRETLEAHAPGAVSEQEIQELVRWVALQDEEPPAPEDQAGDEDDEDHDLGGHGHGGRDRERERGRRSKSRRRSDRADSEGIDAEADDPASARNDEPRPEVGIDGRALDEDSPAGKLDENDDALLLRLMQLKCGGLPIPGSQRSVTYEHVIVDEAQDLSPTDIAVLRRALTKRESMTLAGDTAQKLIFDNGFENWETMLEDVGISGVKIDQLRISYRSTQQVVDFARHVLGPLADPEAPIVPRTGAPVETFTFGSTGETIAFLAESLRALVLAERKANVAVVARYSAIAEMYYQGLKKAEVPSLRRVYGKEFSFAPGIDVVDLPQIKGLEYDYVILVEVNANMYPETKEARHLLHIGATRAVHQLWVCSTGQRSPLLPEETE